MAAATPGTTVKVAGTCAGVAEAAGISQTVYISQSLALQGGYNQADWAAGQQLGVYTTTLDANDQGRVAYVTNNAVVSLDGLLLTHGAISSTNGGAIAAVDADVTINQSIIRDSTVITGQGGGIFANRPITISNSTITNNRAEYDYTLNYNFGYGGGLYVSGALLNASVVVSNAAATGGGGLFNAGGLLTLQNGSQVDSNDSDGWGGGILNDGGSTWLNDSSEVGYNTTGRGGGIYSVNAITGSAYITLTGSSRVQHNWSAFFAGGIFNYRAVTDTLSLVTLQDNSQIVDNELAGGGGGVYNWGFSTDDPSYGAVLSLLDTSGIISNTGLNGGGVYLYQNSSITASGGQIISNTANEKGGGVYVRDGFIDAVDTSVRSNTAISNAGGLYLERGEVTLSDSQVDQNQAGVYAGAIYIDTGAMLITGGSVDQNQATNAGGGLVVGNGYLTLTGTEVLSNVSANAHGGGLWNNAGIITATNTIIANNQAQSNGGGIQNNSGTLVMIGGQLARNTAIMGNGGALYNIDGQASFTQTVFTGNTAASGGGAIRNQNADASLRISQGQLLSNTATGGNGGGLLMINGQVYIEQTTLAGNQASGGGGAIRANNGVLDLINSTLSQNSSLADGGAMYIGKASVSLTNTSVVSNTGNALFKNDTGVVKASNSLIANTVAGAANCASTLGLVSLGHNLASDDTCTGLTAAGDITDTDPLLGALADNGGGTPTIALLPGSPAIDAGDDVTCAAAPVINVDQRDVARPQGAHCDIGAFESRAFTLAMASGDNQAASLNNAFTAPLVVSVTSAYSEPTDGGSATFIGPLSGAGILPITTTAIIAGGAATASVAANGQPGAYSVTVSTIGASPNVTFNLTNTYVITPTSGPNGSITPGTPQLVAAGDSITFTVAANTGYHTADVGVDGVSQGPLGAYTFNSVAANHTLTAAFAINTYIITPTAGANGSITPSTPQTVNYGSALTFTITANVGHHVANVGVDGVSQGVLSSYTFTSVAANHTISAAFAISTYTLTISTAGIGSGVVTPTVGAHVYLYGTVVTLTQAANLTSFFSGWGGNCSGSGACVVTMIGDRAVIANFDQHRLYLPLVRMNP